jgi:hypothetical protein
MADASGVSPASTVTPPERSRHVGVRIPASIISYPYSMQYSLIVMRALQTRLANTMPIFGSYAVIHRIRVNINRSTSSVTSRTLGSTQGREE